MVHVNGIDLKTDNLDTVSISTKIVAIFDVEHPIHGTTYGPNDEPNWVNMDKISAALHVHYLNLNVNQLNTVQIAQI